MICPELGHNYSRQLFLIFSIISIFLFSATALAARTTTSATLNGGSSVTVLPDASITAAVTGTLSSGDDWHSTGWQIRISEGSYNCVNTPDHDSNGIYTETFTITAPSTPGVYNVYFRISGSNSNCGSEKGTVLTMSNAVTVQSSICGNGVIENGEQCDDNGVINGDGCSNTCTIESGWDCSGEPSVCCQLNTFYQDSDSDGYGNAFVTQDACTAPQGYVSDNTDCDDTVFSCNTDCTSVLFQDFDGDTYGNAAVFLRSCDAPQGYVSDNTDCNDNNVNIHPSAAEICNGIDDDCNALTLDGTDETWLNDPTTCGIGECASNGNLICQAGAQIDTCSAGTPSAELCDNLDNDCDGSIADDGVDETWYNQPTSCGIGVCAAAGNWICSSGQQTDTCQIGQPTGNDDNCNGLDDNCNGQIDENYVPDSSCFLPGACAAGNVASSCDNGVETQCTTGLPTQETCNNIDDNCDGNIDEGLTQSTSNQNGLCLGNTETCNAGNWIADQSNYAPVSEICDNLDNDCNGQVDEGLTRPTSCGVGACSGNAGIETCSAGTWGGDTCDPFAGAAIDDSLCNGIDDNCNGQMDEDYVSLPTSCGIGACYSTGSTSCIAGSVVDSCTAGTPAADDATCDGVDNDCNGQTDEGYVPITSCFLPGVCAAGNIASTCVAGVETACTTGQPTGSDDNCNGLDENCDGTADDNYVPIQTNCGLGVCAATGLTSCVSGSVVDSCVAGQPTAEICDGLDNDCDGTIDDFTQACGSGDCIGIQTCTAGVWGTCSSSGNDCGVCASCDNSGSCAYDNTQNSDCNQYNLLEIATCTNNPDSNPFTWDYAAAFNSECIGIFTCSQGSQTITSTCDKANCGAECEVNSDCDDDDIHTIDTCNLDTCGCQHEYVPYCGDGNIDPEEVCELGDSQSCTIDGYSGTQSCDDQCSGWNSCQTNEYCGDDIVNGNEQCDGTLWCDSNCQCETGFVANGQGSCIDNTPPTFTRLSNISVYDNESLSSDAVDAEDSGSGLANLSISNNSNFTIDINGVITNTTELQIGTYNLTIIATDNADNTNSGDIILTISTPPAPVTTDTPAGPAGGYYGGYAGGGNTICEENWSCTDWSPCINGEQNRICIDLNNCTTKSAKPLDSQVCISPISESQVTQNTTGQNTTQGNATYVTGNTGTLPTGFAVLVPYLTNPYLILSLIVWLLGIIAYILYIKKMFIFKRKIGIG
jgi:cysteine-rich repeat protein